MTAHNEFGPKPSAAEIDQYDDVDFDRLRAFLLSASFFPCCRLRLEGEIRTALRAQHVVFIDIGRVLTTLIDAADVVLVQWCHPASPATPLTTYFPSASNPVVLNGA